MNALTKTENPILTRSCAVDFVRIIACLLIIWNHTSGGILNGAFNRLSWANIGVQIFFFMSGYLYSGKEIAAPWTWLKKQTKKIIKPYWLYLLIIFPVMYVLSPEFLSFSKIAVMFFCLQGYADSLSIPPLGHLWFISYILLCYLITPLLSANIHNMENRGGWIKLTILMLIAQTVTVPFALWFKFKSAYIFTYIFGFYYGRRFAVPESCRLYSSADIDDRKIAVEKQWIDALFITAALIGLAIRFYLDIHPLTGRWEPVSDLAVQYSKLFQGGAIFIVLTGLPVWKKKLSFGLQNALAKGAALTYSVYLDHGFFTHKIFTDFLPDAIPLRVLCVWLAIVLFTIFFRFTQRLLNRIIQSGVRFGQKTFEEMKNAGE